MRCLTGLLYCALVIAVASAPAERSLQSAKVACWPGALFALYLGHHAQQEQAFAVLLLALPAPIEQHALPVQRHALCAVQAIRCQRSLSALQRWRLLLGAYAARLQQMPQSCLGVLH